MLLTIDAGNTRTKWAVFSPSGEINQQGTCLNADLMAADLSPQPLNYERVVISNVAGKYHATRLEQKLAPYQLPVRWINASAQACGVFNHYSAPETLGSDRWAALIAAWHMKQSPCVVVNAGTAVTIDAIVKVQAGNAQQGEFIGGMILPGLDLIQQSLVLATAQLPKAEFAPDTPSNAPVNIFAKNTKGAISAGAIHAITGAVDRMAQALEQQCAQTPYIIISGGNALAIQSNLTRGVTKQAIIVDHLVLQGLYLLEKLHKE